MPKDEEIADKELLGMVEESKLGKGAKISGMTRSSTGKLKANGKYSQKTSRGK